eukprot:CAMPEP_0114596550 /NCGR_PEP_ID=MMETSP0125-20121206/18613_1 /TAXON_ID=485358 ORGANISM="Aristerostoma sp., Strain ATCC 50986" /NCGR_SAMPLE_ID=MMETSP0125 /ASSEMBLY_ACC=CAM_ASM_000245 /LENGTH=91 /DNA_ID=CAMNT_0001799779 /DNA_START=154 /DNA_END=429 /DNA_ORIENTATION=+
MILKNPSRYLPELIQNVEPNPDLESKVLIALENAFLDAYFYLAGFGSGAYLNTDFPDFKNCFSDNLEILRTIFNIARDIAGGTLRDYLKAL